jgi:hypothetical protein
MPAVGALVRSRNLLASLDGELRLVNPTGFVEDTLRLTKLDALIPTFRVEPDTQERAGREGLALASAAAPTNARWWGASWNDGTA